ncbi:nicotinate-nicotinamide nucleotide adenylyltransferase [Aspergillus melleus]|uniref:nicotinate-nicotinamide nucleotide adenylyltransferase n=1 Tax=Aspergillus melleus TaxID=138277 RepID=UPI001E8E8103|nr:uncharacterized protein LDX57_006409 [Aspergillus melleus]KAH8428721.1 hypothetical protein LDX57_006409 [Aspergillus melleus]
MSTASFQSLRAKYGTALKQFIQSTRNFEVLGSVSLSPERSHSSPPQVLYVLDSSFNPPTLAHRRIASSALLENPDRPSRLLLLLATQNADKPSKPAGFEDRLAMMELFARYLISYTESLLPAPDRQSLPDVDIGVTKKPYFVDKAADIDAAGVYPASLEQIHLTGFDTLIRIFNPKYYPPTHTLQPLGPFLSQHRLRVTLRPDSDWGSREEQEAYLRTLAQGGREQEGGKREWADRIHLVEGKKPEERSVSSTKAREAVESNNPQDLDWLVPPEVRDFILAMEPYKG